MAKSSKPTGTETVNDYVKKIEEPVKSIVEGLRQAILGVSAEIAEEIKWNAPAFYYTGEMKPFNPKEYKRHIIVMNLRNRILMVFPSGGKIDNDGGLLTGDYADGRRLVHVKTMGDVEAIKPGLQAAIKDWISKVEK